MQEPINHYRKALAAPNGPDYAEQYGDRAAQAAEHGRLAAIRGDIHGLHLAALSLSLITNS